MTNKIFALLAIVILAIFLVSGCIGVPKIGELGGNDTSEIDQGYNQDNGTTTLDDLGSVADDGLNHTGEDPGPVAGE